MPTVLRPTKNNVLAEPLPKTQTVGSLHLPSNAQENNLEAIVKAVGPGRHNAKGVLVRPEVNVGDKILMQRHAGTDIKCDGRTYKLLNATSEILAIL